MQGGLAEMALRASETRSIVLPGGNTPETALRSVCVHLRAYERYCGRRAIGSMPGRAGMTVAREKTGTKRVRQSEVTTRVTEIARKLAKVKQYRVREDRNKRMSKMLQTELVSLMRDVDETDTQRFGFVYDGTEMAGKVIQGKAPSHWADGFVDALKDHGYWESVCSETLDHDKLHSAIARGEIPSSFVEHYREQGTPPRPYVRFVNPEGE